MSHTTSDPTVNEVPAHARGYGDFQGIAREFASDSTPAYSVPIRAREGAPNIVVVLIDDLGFSDLGPYGSEIPTPAIDAVARRGWTFTNYRTAPVCSPARAALLTGLNPHRAGFGMVAHVSPGYPGHTCELPTDAATLAESLRAGGYATFMVGKWHLTVESKMHDGADRASWPVQRGFDRYFGSMDGYTALFHPHRLVRDNSVVDIPEFPDDFFLTDTLTDEALAMIDELRVNDQHRPFFLYFAHAAVHGPVQAKAVDIERFRGRYAAGWDAIRDERVARQRQLGIVDAGVEASADRSVMGAQIPAWDELSSEEQELFARHMEVYAASVAEIDASVARVTAHLERIGELDNTIIVVASDNGGTAEGGLGGTRSYLAQFIQGLPLPTDWVRDVPRDIELVGGPQVHGHYPSGWARVSNTPFRSYKGSLYEGGVHAPLIVSWPGAPEQMQRAGIKREFVFVSDIAPTLLELAGIEPMESLAGRPTQEIDGRSFAPLLTQRTSDGPDSEHAPAGGRERQHFEFAATRALIDGDWKVVAPRPANKADGAAGGDWELYHLASDPTERLNVAKQRPDLVSELGERWRDEAWRNTVFPLNDDGTLFNVRPSTELPLAAPVAIPPFRPPLERFRASKLTVLRSFIVEVDLELGPDAAGIIVSHGDQSGGYQLAVDGGEFLLSYNAYGDMHRATGVLPGVREFSAELFFHELDGLRYRVELVIAGAIVAEIPSVPMLLGMAPFTGISVGYGYGGPVDWELYERHRSYRFGGGTIAHLRYVPGALSKADPTIIHEIEEAARRYAE